MTFHPDSLPDLTGKVYIVTGGTSGIGYHTVSNLARNGAHVYLCARNASKGHAAIQGIQSQNAKARISLLEMDHEILASVVTAAKYFLEREPLLHGLINNAGIMATPCTITGDGYEEQWQTNYLAHWLFTAHLLPRMLQTSKGLPAGSVRIVNVTSSGHYWAPCVGINFDDTALPNEKPLTRYGQSKLANILHVKTLHRLYGPGSSSAKSGDGEIWTAAVHPGLVESQIARRAELSAWVNTAMPMILALGQVDADTGSWTSVFCAAGGDMKSKQSGTYFQRIAKSGWQSGMAKNLELAAKLEDWTQKRMREGSWLE